LFGHEEAWQWRPDLIYFDNLQSYGSAEYYVQKLFSLNPGTHRLTATVEGVPRPENKNKGFFSSATFDKRAEEIIVKAVNVTDESLETIIDVQGVRSFGKTARIFLLTSESLSDENSLAEPRKVYPKETTIKIGGARFTHVFQPYSLTILRIPAER
jgi:alpha-N-arabinofuranosidase